MTRSGKQGPVLTTTENRFVLDGEPIELWGIRTSSATASDDQCQHLIDQLDDYRAHGVNSVTVFYQGCLGENYNPFSADGTDIDDDHQRRMERIIEACAERDMVVVVGIFYQRAPFDFEDPTAVENVLRTVARELKPYGNVLLNTANENTSDYWNAAADVFDFSRPERIVDLCRAVHDEDPQRLVGGGGYHPETNVAVGRADEVDVLCFDTGRPSPEQHDSGALHDRYVAAGVDDKPLVNVELFGGWSSNFPRGVFPDEARRAYEAEIQRASDREGLSIFFHSGPWCQHETEPMRYDLGGQGTAEDPGIRWYFEAVRAARSE